MPDGRLQFPEDGQRFDGSVPQIFRIGCLNGWERSMSFWPVPTALTYFQPIPVLVDETKQRRAIHEDEYRRWQKKEQE